MRELVTSLLRVEELARDLYASAARYFIDDPDFALFLSSLAKDEALHANAMKRAVELVAGDVGERRVALKLEQLEWRERLHDRHGHVW